MQIIKHNQGAQFVGMGQKMAESEPKIGKLYERCSEMLGYDLLKLCREGPKSVLDKTEFAQPAVFVASLAAAKKFQLQYPKVYTVVVKVDETGHKDSTIIRCNWSFELESAGGGGPDH